MGSTTKFSASSLSSPDTLARTQSTASKQDLVDSKAPGYTSNPAIEQHESEPRFEGDSSLAAHSAYAKEFLESAVSHSTPEMFSSPKISEALSSLKQIVEMQSKQRDAGTQRGQLSSRLSARCDIRDLEMPPLPIVLSVLKKAKGKAQKPVRAKRVYTEEKGRKPSGLFWGIYPLLHIRLFHLYVSESLLYDGGFLRRDIHYSQLRPLWYFCRIWILRKGVCHTRRVPAVYSSVQG